MSIVELPEPSRILGMPTAARSIFLKSGHLALSFLKLFRPFGTSGKLREACQVFLGGHQAHLSSSLESGRKFNSESESAAMTTTRISLTQVPVLLGTTNNPSISQVRFREGELNLFL